MGSTTSAGTKNSGRYLCIQLSAGLHAATIAALAGSAPTADSVVSPVKIPNMPTSGLGNVTSKCLHAAFRDESAARNAATPSESWMPFVMWMVGGVALPPECCCVVGLLECADDANDLPLLLPARWFPFVNNATNRSRPVFPSRQGIAPPIRLTTDADADADADADTDAACRRKAGETQRHPTDSTTGFQHEGGPTRTPETPPERAAETREDDNL
mmetsp:Transcript_4976/g.13003  ORF Transcript_4976/g.13003 Transcript_4976/m.13003 type:complete len:215 (-) Transcript_4976:188-832(-)